MNGAWQSSEIGHVTSKDRTHIGYRRLGHGPGVIVLHGGMESAASHAELAEALAESHTVYVPDRRGRGLSGPYGEDYTVQKEVDDMGALLDQTGVHNVFGVSSAAIVWLHAMLALPAIRKAAIYEPPLAVGGKWSGSWTPREFLQAYEAELARGDVASALALGLKVTQMGPPIMGRLPLWLLRVSARPGTEADALCWRRTDRSGRE